MALPAGAKLGPYEILAPIGAGGMGEVYKARDPRLGGDVAIKVPAARFSERFEREARTIAALNPPGIRGIYDAGPDYLVMEYIDGAPPRGPLADEKSITHRDLRRANILVTRSGRKPLDFGLALVDDNSAAGIAGAPASLSVMGPVAYMSPEQTQGKPADARSDVFSLALVLYEPLSGHQAFAKNYAVETVAAIIREDPAPLDAPSRLSEVVGHCLRKAPGARFQTMTEVRAALEQFAATPARSSPAIVVLPFADMSVGKEHEYFSDGLAEQLINALANIPGLKAIARTFAFVFKGQNTDILRNTESLVVANFLEGGVRRSGNRIRVTAQPLASADEEAPAARALRPRISGLFAMQDEISAAIAGVLHTSLSPLPASTPGYTPKRPAWEALLKR